MITYLANSIRKNNKATPYSFVAALPVSLYPLISTGNNIIINRWLADDLDASMNDTVGMSWYAPATNGKLEEKSDKFIVIRIVEPDSIWADPALCLNFRELREPVLVPIGMPVFL